MNVSTAWEWVHPHPQWLSEIRTYGAFVALEERVETVPERVFTVELKFDTEDEIAFVRESRSSTLETTAFHPVEVSASPGWTLAIEAFHAAKPTAIAPKVAAKPVAKRAPF